MPSFLARVYVFKFADAFILIYPLYAVMFVDKGLSGGQIGFALAAWSVTAFLVQAPAGVWADRWSRRGILIIAQALRVGGYALWLFEPGFWGFAGGLVLWGFKSGLTGGCFEALVYDELKAAGREDDYTRVAGRADALQFTGILCASLAATVVAPMGYGVLLIGSIASCALAMLIPFTFPRAPRSATAGDLHYFAHLRLGLSQTVRSPAILGLVVFIAVTLTFGGALDEFWAIFAKGAGLNHSAIALFIAVMSAGQAAAAALAHRLRALATGWYYALFAANGALLAAAAAFFRPAAVVLLVVFVWAFKVIDIVFEGRLQHALPSETRATIASVKAFVTEVAMTLLYLAFGPLAQATSYRTAFLATGVMIGVIGLGLLGWRLTRPREPITPSQ